MKVIIYTKLSHPSDAERYPTHSFCLEQLACGTLCPVCSQRQTPYCPVSSGHSTHLVTVNKPAGPPRSLVLTKEKETCFCSTQQINTYSTNCLLFPTTIHEIHNWYSQQVEKNMKHGALRRQKPFRLIRDGEVGGSGLIISNTYSLHCHHQNDSALRWAAV